jgi:hypothetical protein
MYSVSNSIKKKKNHKSKKQSFRTGEEMATRASTTQQERVEEQIPVMSRSEIRLVENNPAVEEVPLRDTYNIFINCCCLLFTTKQFTDKDKEQFKLGSQRIAGFVLLLAAFKETIIISVIPDQTCPAKYTLPGSNQFEYSRATFGCFMNVICAILTVYAGVFALCAK